MTPSSRTHRLLPRSAVTAIVPLALLIAAASCSTSGGGYQPPAGPHQIEGFITSWDVARPSAVLVEEVPGEETGGRKIQFRLDADTQLLRWNDDAGGYGTIDPTDLSEGQRVRVWNIGPIAESYPEQARAHTIVLVSDP